MRQSHIKEGIDSIETTGSVIEVREEIEVDGECERHEHQLCEGHSHEGGEDGGNVLVAKEQSAHV